MKYFIILLLISITNLNSQERRLIPNPIRNIPKWVRTEFSTQHLDNRYSIVYQLYPYYLKGDFNGDGRRDVAIQIAEKKSGKFGIAIFHTKKRQALITPISILGAGNHLSSIGNDFKWVNVWDMIDQKESMINATEKKVLTLEGDAISIGQRDSTSGLIYWDGKKYTWIKLKNTK